MLNGDKADKEEAHSKGYLPCTCPFLSFLSIVSRVESVSALGNFYFVNQDIYLLDAYVTYILHPRPPRPPPRVGSVELIYTPSRQTDSLGLGFIREYLSLYIYRLYPPLTEQQEVLRGGGWTTYWRNGCNKGYVV